MFLECQRTCHRLAEMKFFVAGNMVNNGVLTGGLKGDSILDRCSCRPESNRGLVLAGNPPCHLTTAAHHDSPSVCHHRWAVNFYPLRVTAVGPLHPLEPEVSFSSHLYLFLYSLNGCLDERVGILGRFHQQRLVRS
jgi:hypothetical protein